MLPFVAESVHYLRDVYLPRLRAAVHQIDDLWAKPHARTNSVGNLLLHLEGNVRQWIIHGLGGAPDHRTRSAEFAAREGDDPLPALVHTVHEACEVLEKLDRELDDPYENQGIETTVLGAIYHVVEHFSWHVGQIVTIAKLREDHGIAFYDDAALE